MDKKTQLCGNPILVEYETSRRKKIMIFSGIQNIARDCSVLCGKV